jgi:Fic family protein
LAGIFDEISLDEELAYAEGAIGDEATSEISRKGPKDGGLRVCGQSPKLRQNSFLNIDRTMRITPFVPERLPIKDLDWASLVPYIGEAREALARYDEALKTASAKRLETIAWEESIASLRTLDLHADLEEVLRYAKKKSKRSLKLQKIIQAKTGLSFAIAWAKKRPINTAFYCRLHAIVKQDAPNQKEAGRLRARQNWIGPQGCSIDEAYFYPPEAKKVKKYLLALNAYARGKEKDPIVQAAILFAQFLIIHPFMDGNGRVARIAIPLFLMKKGLLSKPYLFMSEYFAAHRLAYFQKLFNISEKRAWEDWIIYFLKGVAEQSANLLARI